MSTITPSRFISRMTSLPKSVRPLCTALSVEESAHAWNVDAPGSAALAEVELAVKQALRGVVMRVRDNGGEVQLARFFRDGIGGDRESRQGNRRNTHDNQQQSADHSFPPVKCSSETSKSND